jgi:ribosomal protein S18 acetylase RimI-like enzyme
MNYHVRVMTAADIPAGMRLKEIAGWNQTPGDWERFLRSSPQGCFVAEVDGFVVGSAATIAYEGRFAWIGMVLVDPVTRGKGIGTRLLEKTIEYLDGCGIPSMKLDATPQGKPLYQKLGFASEYEIERWVLKRAGSDAAPPGHAGELKEVLAFDHEIFGADRSELLRSVAQEAPQFVLEERDSNRLAGYAFGREGSKADHLGPWVAQDEETARNLLQEFLHRSRQGLVFVDAMKSNPWAIALLRHQGFEHARPLTRMFRGRNDFPGQPELQCAILGPEFG